MLLVGITLTLLVKKNVIDQKHKYLLLFGLIGAIGTNCGLNGFSWEDVGIQKFDKYSLITYFIVTAVTLLIIELTQIRSKLRCDRQNKKVFWENVWFYIFLSAPLQEFMSRGYILPYLKMLRWNNLVIFLITSTFIFAFSHYFIENKWVWIGATVLGLVWGVSYWYYPNLVLISISHGIIGYWALGFKGKTILDPQIRCKNQKDKNGGIEVNWKEV